MKSSKVVFVLAIVALAEASPRSLVSSSADEDLGRAFIECARKAILTGIPEINIPSHNPLIIPGNFSQNIDLGVTRGLLKLYNIIMEDIPIWEVRQFDLLDSSSVGVDIFNYTIYWPKIILKLQWQFSTKLGDLILSEIEGSMSLEYDHVNFAGILNFTKPGSNRMQNINELFLDVTTREAQLNITNLGKIGALVNQDGGEIFAYLLNHNPAKDLLGVGLKIKLNRDWMSKPDRLNTLISKCKEISFLI